MVERHFWLKRDEIEAQLEDWIQDMERGSTDKRTGRTIAHSTVALKVTLSSRHPCQRSHMSKHCFSLKFVFLANGPI